MMKYGVKWRQAKTARAGIFLCLVMMAVALFPSISHARNCAGLGLYHYNDTATGKCYYLGSEKSYTEAQASCAANGGYLATIENAAKNAMVVAAFPGSGDVYVGGTDSAEEGTWKWLGGKLAGMTFWEGDETGSAQNGLYTNWNSGEPNNSAGGAGEDCIAIHMNTGLWNDVICTWPRPYLCEIPACDNPEGEIGKIIYNSDSRTPQYCNGNKWVPMGQPNYAATAMRFNGSSAYLTKDTDLAGSIDSVRFTTSFWFKTNYSGGSQIIMQSGPGSFQLYLTSTGKFQIDGHDSIPISTGQQVLNLRTVNGGFNDGKWHHVLIAMDLSDTALRHIYIDGVAQDLDVDGYIDGAIDFTASTGYRIGSNGSAYFFNGALADLWFDIDTYLDITNAAVRDKFFRAPNRPVDLGADGSGPTGSSPDIFLSGAENDWQTNKGTGGGFTPMGSAYEVPGPGNLGRDIRNGLVGHWTFNENSGAAAASAAGLGPAGVLTNMDTSTAWINGQIGSALDFDGVNDYVDLFMHDSYKQTGDVTLSAWIRADSTSDLRRIITIPRDESAGFEFLSLAINEGTIQFIVDEDVWGGYVSASAPYALSGWHHVVGILRGTQLRLYIDGVLRDTQSHSGAARVYNSGNLAIGRYGPTFGQYFDGGIDDVRIYSRALTSSEVASLYEWGLAAGNRCENPERPAGTIIYNEGSNVLQFCNGESWQALGPVPGSGGLNCGNPAGNPGSVIFNSTAHVMQYCDGSVWQAMPGLMASGLKSLIHHWPLNEASGATSYVDLASGQNCTTSGSNTSITTPFGTGLRLNNSHLDCGVVSSLVDSEKFTISAWIRRTAGSLHVGVEDGTDATTGITNFHNGNYYLTIAAGEGWTEGETPVPSSGWHHVTMVYDGTLAGSDRLKGYVDGLRVTLSGGGIPSRTSDLIRPFRIGGFSSPNATGEFGDVRVYDEPLTDDEVLALYYLTKGSD